MFITLKINTINLCYNVQKNVRNNMQVVSMTEARNNFKAIFDAVFHNNEEVIIHRKGRENVVVVPFEEYDILKKAFNHDYMSWHKKELENIGKIGLDSKSFVEDNEDYSKW